jgi:hypothetical protein
MSYGRVETLVTGQGEAGVRRGLLAEVRARMRVRHCSLRTESAYLYWIRRYIRGRRASIHVNLTGGGGRLPDPAGDLRQGGASTQNQARSRYRSCIGRC